jgi:hypothetical protein
MPNQLSAEQRLTHHVGSSTERARRTTSQTNRALAKSKSPTGQSCRSTAHASTHPAHARSWVNHRAPTSRYPTALYHEDHHRLHHMSTQSSTISYKLPPSWLAQQQTRLKLNMLLRSYGKPNVGRHTHHRRRSIGTPEATPLWSAWLKSGACVADRAERVADQ